MSTSDTVLALTGVFADYGCGGEEDGGTYLRGAR
jgi:hypothetical protein